MKRLLIFLILILSLKAFAEKDCDIRVGKSLGVKVMEFSSGKEVHSKMAMQDVTPDAIFEEIISLQEMGICNEKIFSQKCVLKLLKGKNTSKIVLIRNKQALMIWSVPDKNKAQYFVKSLMRIGFCS